MLVNIAQYNTHSAHTIRNTQPHTAYKTHNTSARYIASHHMTSPDITPHALSHTTHYTTLHTQHMAPQPKLAILLCPLDCVCGVGVWVVCALCYVFVLCVLCVVLCCVCIVRVLWSVSSVWSLLSVVLCRVVISLVVLPLVSVVLSLLRCVSVFCASCAFWCTHQHMVIVCRVCVVCVLGSAVSRLLEHVIRNQSSGRKPESGVVGLVCPVFCCGPRSMITYVVLMSSFHVALLSSCHVLCWWLSSCRGRHVGVV